MLIQGSSEERVWFSGNGRGCETQFRGGSSCVGGRSHRVIRRRSGQMLPISHTRQPCPNLKASLPRRRQRHKKRSDFNKLLLPTLPKDGKILLQNLSLQTTLSLSLLTDTRKTSGLRLWGEGKRIERVVGEMPFSLQTSYFSRIMFIAVDDSGSYADIVTPSFVLISGPSCGFDGPDGRLSEGQLRSAYDRSNQMSNCLSTYP